LHTYVHSLRRRRIAERSGPPADYPGITTVDADLTDLALRLHCRSQSRRHVLGVGRRRVADTTSRRVWPAVRRSQFQTSRAVIIMIRCD
jgi:hypothetical protein